MVRQTERDIPGWMENRGMELDELVNRALDRGVVLSGDAALGVAGVDLIYLGLKVVLSSSETLLRGTAGTAALVVEDDPEAGPDAAIGAGAGAAAQRGQLAPLAEGRPAPRAPAPRAPAPSPPGGSIGEASGEDARVRTVGDAPSPEAPARMEAPAQTVGEARPADATRGAQGLARLVLTLVELLRRVLEHQAMRRMDGGGLASEEVERLGLALMRLQARLEDLREAFELREEDLRVDLGPLGGMT